MIRGGSSPHRRAHRGREFKRGTRLPPERDLSTEYGVAYNTVRRSMDVLRERGLVITLRGHGNYVARKP